MHDDVDDEEQQPDRPRDFVDALSCSLGRQERRMVDLIVERADEAEDDREDAADEDREEIVDARAAAAQPIEALNVEGERHEHAEERQQVEVLPERWLPLGDRDEIRDARLESQEIGDGERRHAEQRVGEDVEGNEQAVVPPHHRAGPRGDRLRRRRQGCRPCAGKVRRRQRPEISRGIALERSSACARSADRRRPDS